MHSLIKVFERRHAVAVRLCRINAKLGYQVIRHPALRREYRPLSPGWPAFAIVCYKPRAVFDLLVGGQFMQNMREQLPDRCSEQIDADRVFLILQYPHSPDE